MVEFNGANDTFNEVDKLIPLSRVNDKVQLEFWETLGLVLTKLKSFN